jgi:hypothetical protein
MQATYEDANLILRLYEIRREETLRKAREWFFVNYKIANAQEAMTKYAMGSQENTYARMVISYWDMACSFVTAGVLNPDLFFQSNGECLIVWEKVRGFVGDLRAMTKNPQMWGNLEKVGNDYIKFIESRGPEAYTAFQGMLKMIDETLSKTAKP